MPSPDKLDFGADSLTTRSRQPIEPWLLFFARSLSQFILFAAFGLGMIALVLCLMLPRKAERILDAAIEIILRASLYALLATALLVLADIAQSLRNQKIDK